MTAGNTLGSPEGFWGFSGHTHCQHHVWVTQLQMHDAFQHCTRGRPALIPEYELTAHGSWQPAAAVAY